jgi:hypothetical protein
MHDPDLATLSDVTTLAVASLRAILDGHYPEDAAYKYDDEDDIYPLRSSDDIRDFVEARLKEIDSLISGRISCAT